MKSRIKQTEGPRQAGLRCRRRLCVVTGFISRPPPSTPFLRLVVSGWRRKGNLLRLTMARCTCRPSCGDMSRHTSCPAPKGGLTRFGETVDVDGDDKVLWFVSQSTVSLS